MLCIFWGSHKFHSVIHMEDEEALLVGYGLNLASRHWLSHWVPITIHTLHSWTSSSSTGRMMLKWTLCWTALMGADIHEKGDFHLWHDQSHHQADLGMLKHLHCCLNVTTRIFTVSLRTFSTSQKIHMWCQWALVEFLSIAAFQFRTYLRKLRFALSKTPSRASLYSIAT